MEASTTNIHTQSINQCEALLAQADLYLPAIVNTLYDIPQPPSTTTKVIARASKIGKAQSNPYLIVYVVLMAVICVTIFFT